MKEKLLKSKTKIGKYSPEKKRFIGIAFHEKENMIEHPNHYTWIPGIECFDVVKHFDFCRGAAIKYIWRSGKKGNEIEDLEKAIQCLKKRIEFLKND